MNPAASTAGFCLYKASQAEPDMASRSKCLALVLPDDGRGAQAERVADVVTDELRVAAVPYGGRDRPRVAARHGEE